MNDVPEGAYPFTTIDPSIGEAYVRVDCAAPEFGEECEPSTGFCRDHTRFVPTKLVNDIDFLEAELDQWYLGILEKGIERYEGRHMEEVEIEVELAEQMSAFRTNKDQIKQTILAVGLDLDPDTWDADDRFALAQEIRKRTKPMVVAANKMDTPAAKENYEAITTDPGYDHLTIVPCSAHAEKALKHADEQGVLDYRPGDADFTLTGDVSPEQEQGLEQIRDFIQAYDGTGVQAAIEAALFDVLGVVSVFPGTANGDWQKGPFRDCFLLPPGSTAEDFAYHLHSDIGDGFLHALDCRSKRQIGASHELGTRDVVEIISTAQ